MKFTAEQLIKVHQQIRGDTAQWLTTWENIARLFQPNKVGFVSEASEGQVKTEEIYDSIGMETLDDLSNFLQASMTPQESVWFQLGFMDPELDKNDSAREWIEKCEGLLRKEIEDSNFYGVSSEFYKDVASFGTASMSCEPRTDVFGTYRGLAYRVPHLRGIVALPNQYGDNDTVIEEHVGFPNQFISRFGQDAGRQIHEDALKRPAEKYTFLHAVYPRDAADIDKAALSLQDATEDRLPYASLWVNMKERHTVKESGYYEPYTAVARWDANTDNTFAGHGPGMRAYPNVATINEASRIELAAWEKSIDPPTKELENAVVGNLNVGPGGRTIVSNMNGLEPLYNGTNWDLAFLKREELSQAVERIMFSDLIREPTNTSSGTTAYEVAKRMERAQRILGEAIGRIKSEWLRWLITRSFSVMYRNERFPMPPDEVVNAEAELEVRYVSPLQIAQAAGGLENTRSFMADMGAAAMLQNPENPGEAPILDIVDWDGYARESASRYSVPATALRGKDEMQTARDQRTAEEAAQAKIDAIEKVGKGVSGIGQGAGQEAATQMMEGLGG